MGKSLEKSLPLIRTINIGFLWSDIGQLGGMSGHDFFRKKPPTDAA